MTSKEIFVQMTNNTVSNLINDLRHLLWADGMVEGGQEFYEDDAKLEEIKKMFDDLHHSVNKKVCFMEK